MEQYKCGEIYRDIEGRMSYACSSCTADFLSAIEFEEHVIEHFLEVETYDEQTSLIKIETLGVAEYINDDPVEEEMEEGDLFDEIEVLEDNDTDYDKFVQCSCCNEYYACQGLMEKHLRKKEDPDSVCGECPAYFEKNDQLLAHRKIHNSANLFTCNQCLEVFATEKKLEAHRTPPLPPPPPPQKTSPKKQLKQEKRERSASPSEEPAEKGKSKYTCDLCNKEYTYLHYLKQHLKKHKDNTLMHSCDVCGHEFKLRQNLLAHMRIHTGEKPFECKLCGKSFNQPYYMTVHMRIHQKEKPYQCSLCGVSFVTSSHLGRHMKSHNNIKPHKCTMCEKAFILPGHLNDHIRSQHTGERPFNCEVCGNTFSRRKLLRQHMQLHGEKKFKCKYCNLAFAQSAGRRGHELRVHAAP